MEGLSHANCPLWLDQFSLFGATIVRVEKGKITQWSDYYDQSSSRRMSLGAFFTDWIEY
jgi:limonene-1,2-epoxide hydrolase